MGRGGAQLGKAIKGKAKERRKGEKGEGRGKGAVLDVNGNEVPDDGLQAELYADVKALEEYERQAAQAEWHRRRMNEVARAEKSVRAIAAATLHRLYRQWRREEKSAEMRWELQVLTQSHTVEVQRKEHWIRTMQQHMDTAKTQSADTPPPQRCTEVRSERCGRDVAHLPLTPLLRVSVCRLCVAQRGHLQSVSRLCALHAGHLHDLEADFHAQLGSLRAHFESELSGLRTHQSVSLRELELLIAAVEAEEAERVNEAKQSHETEREEVRNKNLEAINELRITLENRIEELERAFDDHHRYYRESTDSAAEHFRQLKAEDAQLSLSIFEKKRRLHKLHSSLLHWRQKLALNEKEGQEKNLSLQHHRQHLQAQCDQLKQRMHSFRSTQQRRLMTLTQQAQQSIEQNQQAVQRAATIIQLAQMARSKETEKEKVLMQPTTTAPLPAAAAQRAGGEEEKTQLMLLGGDGAATESTALTASSPSSSAAQSMSSSSLPSPAGPLSRFFAAYNKVVLDVLSMEAEKSRLAEENRMLRRQLKRFLDGLAVTESTISAVNPLLIVNGRWTATQSSTTPLHPPRLVQDGTQLLQNTRRQLPQMVEVGRRRA